MIVPDKNSWSSLQRHMMCIIADSATFRHTAGVISREAFMDRVLQNLVDRQAINLQSSNEKKCDAIKIKLQQGTYHVDSLELARSLSKFYSDKLSH